MCGVALRRTTSADLHRRMNGEFSPWPGSAEYGNIDAESM